MKYLATILVILPLLWPVSGSAQSGDSAEAPPLFDVEIVVFRNVKAPKSREFILPVSSPARDEQMLDLSSTSSLKAVREQGYEILPADQLRLLDEVAKLVESSRYDLLLHAGWRQPGLDQQQALPVWIRGGRIYGKEYTSIDDRIEPGGALPYGSAQGEEKEYQFDAQTSEARQQQLEKQLPDRSGGHYELEGKITITLSRYLHAWVDLVMRRPRLTIDEAPDNPIQEEYLATRAADTRILNNHSLRERRRMRSRHLHYLDNPEFAMLILITPYDAAAAAEAARADAAEDATTATE
jgi:hypothetical protein